VLGTTASDRTVSIIGAIGLTHQMALQVRPRKKRKGRYVRGNVIPSVSRPKERCSIDFIHDRLTNGRNLRAIAIIDAQARSSWISSTVGASRR
jgi:hypothetical protein